MRNVKRRSRLKTDETNIYILCEEKDGEETVPPDFSFAAPSSLAVLPAFPWKEGQSICGMEISTNPGQPTNLVTSSWS